MKDYQSFIASKRTAATPVGFDVALSGINPKLFEWQRRIVQWACRMGRAAIFAECGLGKTAMQMEWARLVHLHTGRKIINLTPLAVAYQAVDEAAKFDVAAAYCRSQAEADASSAPVIVTNYEMLGAFDPSRFSGVSLDESSILKSFMGATKRKIVESFAHTPYRLANTATPAPNDHLELGNHSEFLGVMPSYEMLMRWFINDTMKAGGYRLKKHAERDYWRWVASWAVCIAKPSDIGGDDAGFELPLLELIDHVVSVDHSRAHAQGRLFLDGTMSATAMWQERRETTADRCNALAEIVEAEPNEAWAVWCDTNDESDYLKKIFRDAVEVRGSDKPSEKESKLRAFSEGNARIIITKPDIAGFGLNWQHSARAGFVGVTYSFEKTYQALRRQWRFGQSRPVKAHMVYAESEGGIRQSLVVKQAQHREMQNKMSAAMREVGLIVGQSQRQLLNYNPELPIVTPDWLRTKQPAHFYGA